MSTLRLTILCDDVVSRAGLESDHGLAVLIERPDCRVLLDAASGERVVRNARALGVALTPLDAIVLSHGHYDHTGGLEAVLREAAPVQVVAHPEVFKRTFACRPDGTQRYIGAPLSQDDYEALGATFLFSDEPVQLGESFWTTGQVEQQTIYDTAPPPLCVERDGGLVPDDFADDLSLVVALAEGLVIITGCAHAGPVNIVRQARAQTGVQRVHCVIGGTHLGPVKDEDVCDTARRLHELGVELIAPSHCTGPRAFQVLRHSFPGRTVKVGAGDILDFTDEGVLHLNASLEGECCAEKGE